MTNECKFILPSYLPPLAIEPVAAFIKHYAVAFHIANSRKSKWGDYCWDVKRKQHRISINKDLSPCRFLIVTLHEFAHLLTKEQHTRKVLPHGKEWKQNFASLLQEYLYRGAFPESVTQLLQSYGDNLPSNILRTTAMAKAIQELETVQKDGFMLADLSVGDVFAYMKTTWILREIKRTRCICTHCHSGKRYSIHKTVWISKTE